eukprot:g5824.t1
MEAPVSKSVERPNLVLALDIASAADAAFIAGKFDDAGKKYAVAAKKYKEASVEVTSVETGSALHLLSQNYIERSRSCYMQTKTDKKDDIQLNTNTTKNRIRSTTTAANTIPTTTTTTTSRSPSSSSPVLNNLTFLYESSSEKNENQNTIKRKEEKNDDDAIAAAATVIGQLEQQQEQRRRELASTEKEKRNEKHEKLKGKHTSTAPQNPLTAAVWASFSQLSKLQRQLHSLGPSLLQKGTNRDVSVTSQVRPKRFFSPDQLGESFLVLPNEEGSSKNSGFPERKKIRNKNNENVTKKSKKKNFNEVIEHQQKEIDRLLQTIGRLTTENTQLLQKSEAQNETLRENKQLRKQIKDFKKQYRTHFGHLKSAMEEFHRRHENTPGKNKNNSNGIRPHGETLAAHVKDLERGFRKVSKKLKAENAKSKAQEKKLRQYKTLLLQMRDSMGDKIVKPEYTEKRERKKHK